MTSKEKRLQEIVRGLPPEEKARLAIEDALRKEPALSPGDRHRMVRALNHQDGARYDKAIDRYQSLLANLRLLTQLSSTKPVDSSCFGTVSSGSSGRSSSWRRR